MDRLHHHRALRVLATPKGIPQLCGDHGELVVNDLEVVDASNPPFQARICDSCRTEGCSRGYWYAPRRYGEAVVWVPNEWMTEDPVDDAHWFTGAAIRSLEQEVRGHARFEVLPPLDRRDAVRLLQLSGPGAVLGYPGEPLRLKRELILVADGSELDDVIHVLSALAVTGATPLPFPSREAVPVDLYLDLPGTPVWTPLARSPDGSWWLLPLGRDLEGAAPRQ